MSHRIPETFIDDMLARTDIVDLIDSYVPLKKAGKNYTACCPFHQEKTPSFTVSPDKQFFYCFGCGANGNSVGFLMDYNNLGFVDAMQKMADLNGTEIPLQSQDIPLHNNKLLYESLEQANQFYQKQLRQHAQKASAVSYLKTRGLSGQIAKSFEIGYAPPGWDNFIDSLRKQPKPDKLISAGVEAGLIIEKDKDRHYDRFRDRIMFPIKDKRGRVIAFGGRVLGDDKPKYLNSPETPVFYKNKELYGLFQALQKDRHFKKALIVEGYMDVIALAQQGIHYAMATLGTATSESHLETLFRLCDEVVFCFDGDEAGRKAAWRALENTLPTLRDGRQATFLFLPEGEDPDTLVRKEGKALFEHRINNATPLSEYLFNTLSTELNLQTMDGRAALATKTKPLLDKLPVGVFKQLMLDQLAKITQMDIDKLIVAIEPISTQQSPDSTSQPKRQHLRDEGVNRDKEHDYVDETPLFHPTHYEPLDTSHLAASHDAPHYNFGNKSHSRQFGRPYRKFKPKREAIHTAPLLDRSIRLLLQKPELARNANIPAEIRQITLPNSDLFFSLLELFQENPNTSTAYLFGLWHETEAGSYLAKLAAQEFLVTGQEEHELEFNDAIKRLHILSVEQAIDQESKRQSPDGNRLKELLNLKSQLK